MKKNFYFVVLAFMLILFSCTGFEVQPKFVTVFGLEEKNVNLETYERLADNSVRLTFSDLAEVLDVAVHKSAEQQLVCSIEKEEAGKIHLIRIADEIGIGENYSVVGKVKSGKTTQDFNLKFIGANINPARMSFVEYKPTHSSAKASDPEFIKLKVEEAGNLSEFVIRGVGDKKSPDYFFPPCEVSKGEIILVHLHAKAEKNADANFEDETGENISSDIKRMRDFYARNFEKPAKRDTCVVLLDDGNEKIFDFLVYVQKKGFVDGEIIWSEEAKSLISKLEKTDLKEAFEIQCKNLTPENISPTYSLVKINGVWKREKYNREKSK
ncbi:MAG: hypothetical protein P1P64_06845 [Treponemataceae bacterium]